MLDSSTILIDKQDMLSDQKELQRYLDLSAPLGNSSSFAAKGRLCVCMSKLATLVTYYIPQITFSPRSVSSSEE